MIIKFNPTGTHVHKGFLKVRVDIYPEPTDKTYSIHYVDKPIFPPEGYPGEADKMGTPVDVDKFNQWIASLPTKKELNPCLCHFIKVDANVQLVDLLRYINNTLTVKIMAQIDDVLSQPNSVKNISHMMRGKTGVGGYLSSPVDIESVNARLSSSEEKV